LSAGHLFFQWRGGRLLGGEPKLHSLRDRREENWRTFSTKGVKFLLKYWGDQRFLCKSESGIKLPSNVSHFCHQIRDSGKNKDFIFNQ